MTKSARKVIAIARRATTPKYKGQYMNHVAHIWSRPFSSRQVDDFTEQYRHGVRNMLGMAYMI
eukprot:7076481-Lingulodinium_polyedra.AAC.1